MNLPLMDLQLNGKRALVTGSSSGIGEGIARMLAQQGARVVVHGRNLERTRAIADDIGGVTAIGDLSGNEGADAVAAVVEESLGGIDILVNNAGGADGTSALSWQVVDEEDWLATYQKNVVAATRMIRRFLPGMKSRGWGRIIQIASAAATQPIATGPDYGCAKAAMVNLTASLTRHLGDCGVTANTLSPGMVLTPAVEQWMTDLAQQPGWQGMERDQIERKLTTEAVPTALRRAGRVDEIAFAVCMMASPRLGFMAGANLRIDGGQVQAIN